MCGLPHHPCDLAARRYKQLLLKQRDIMIALTARLNERDEQIMTLQVRVLGQTPRLDPWPVACAIRSTSWVPCPPFMPGHHAMTCWCLHTQPHPTRPRARPPVCLPALPTRPPACTACLPLQEELEAYDRHQRLLEDNLDSKTAEIIQLRRAALEAAADHLQQVRE